jgi:CHAT domain-containing protein
MDEISQLRLTADLVVLSACQTGLGEEVAGEGVLGLSRAVLQAGARSVVASLWNVADETTAMFMTRFHTYLAKDGVAKARALQRAKLDFLRQTDQSSPAAPVGSPNRGPLQRSHPFFWAPFILIGED